MELIRFIRTEVDKNIRNISFVACALLVTVLCFTANAYTSITSAGNSQAYTVIELFLNFSNRAICRLGAASGSAQFLFMRGIGEYAYLFMPMIAAASFVPIYCSERNSGLIRFELIRGNKLRYVAVKQISAMLTGGCIVTAGYLLYGFIVAILFPWASQFNDLSIEVSMLAVPSLTLSMLLSCIGAFLYGAVSVLPAFLFCSIFRNPYVISCLPFVLIYIKNTAITRLLQDNPSLDWLFTLFYTYSVRSLVYGTTTGIASACYLTICAMLVFLACWLIVERRLDSGA